MITKLKPLTLLTGFFLILFGTEVDADTKITTLGELKAIQAKVQAVSKKVLPATVSLVSNENNASGSGVIISESGLILTAGHVVRGTNEMTVIFPNGSQALGKVLGANYTRDSAMLQIVSPKKKWPYAEIGHSKNLQVGDLVVALGHSGGYDAVRTPPVRFGRIVTRGNNKFIVTDCTLIGGDSGGPLFDLEGRVIGIHSSIEESLSANNHASIEGFRLDWDRLIDGETWGRLGGNHLDDPDSPILGIITAPSTHGIAIRAVIERGPAAEAGLRAGDILLSINGKQVTNLRNLYIQLSNHKPGNIVIVRVARGEDHVTRKVLLGRLGNL